MFQDDQDHKYDGCTTIVSLRKTERKRESFQDLFAFVFDNQRVVCLSVFSLLGLLLFGFMGFFILMITHDSLFFFCFSFEFAICFGFLFCCDQLFRLTFDPSGFYVDCF